MNRSSKLAALFAAAIVALVPLSLHAQAQPRATPTAVTDQRFANGNDWQKASLEEKRAFLYGIANAISVALGWDERHVPVGQVTFSRRARDGLAGVSLGEVVSRVDAWYANNPTRLDTPIVAVMWLDIAKPKLKGRK
jgi:hypothetical protein